LREGVSQFPFRDWATAISLVSQQVLMMKNHLQRTGCKNTAIFIIPQG
jgi:hypothetical protein